jgi:hypothetical protein
VACGADDRLDRGVLNRVADLAQVALNLMKLQRRGEVVGLSEALLCGGSESVLASLWPVTRARVGIVAHAMTGRPSKLTPEVREAIALAIGRFVSSAAA